MSFLIVFACAIAAASAGNLITPSYLAQHLPLIGPNGLPLETPEVQQAKAVHLAHKLEAHARNGNLAYAPLIAPITSIIAPTAYSTSIIPSAFNGVPLDTPEVTAAKINHFAAHAQATYGRAAIIPAAINGVPLDTPEVTAAKINHFAAHAQALARNGQPAIVLNRKRRGIIAAPIAYSTSYNTHLIGGAYSYSRPLYTNTYAATYTNPYQYYRYY